MILAQETTIVVALLAGLALAVFLVVAAQPLGRPRPTLAELFRQQDAQALARADLARALGMRDAAVDYRPTGLEAALRPLVEEGGRLVAGLLALVHLGPDAATLERRLARAGTPMSASQFVGQQLTSGLLLGTVFPLLNLLGLRPLGPWPLWLALVAFGVGYLLPLWALSARLEAQRRALLVEVPNLLDDVVLATSAGLSVEAAVAEVAAHGTGPLADALRAARREVRLDTRGSVVDALARAAATLDSPELDGTVAALRLAEEQGASLGATLRAQAQALRTRRRLLIVEAAGKGLVRMTVIVGFTIVPALLLALLYPAAVRLLQLGDI